LLQGGIRTRYNWTRPVTDPPTPACGWANRQFYSSYRPSPSSEEAAVPYPLPFFLDGRSNTAQNECDQIASRPWSSNEGIRNRGYVTNVVRPERPNVDSWTKNDSIIWIEEVLLTEAALECGFEGFRWGDMMRIAHRKNKYNEGTGTEFLNELLSNKFETEGRTAAPVISPSNGWFLQRKD